MSDEILVRCKYYVINSEPGMSCNRLSSKSIYPRRGEDGGAPDLAIFNCGSPIYIACDIVNSVTWTYFIINRKHLIEVKD